MRVEVPGWRHHASTALLMGALACADGGSNVADTGDTGSGAAGAGGALPAGGTGGTQANSGCPEALELRVAEFVEEDEPLVRLNDGDALHLWNAPQGGHVVTVGAEVRGTTSEIVAIEARLLDLETGELVKDDVRSIVMKPIEGADAWMSPDIRSRNQVAHIAMCPDPERRLLLDQEFVLEIEISEIDTECQSTGKASVLVVPRCLQEIASERAFCECQCQQDYAAGSCG